MLKATIGRFEFWVVDGQVYRNEVGNRGYLLPCGVPSSARWECSVQHFERYRPLGVFGA